MSAWIIALALIAADAAPPVPIPKPFRANVQEQWDFAHFDFLIAEKPTPVDGRFVSFSIAAEPALEKSGMEALKMFRPAIEKAGWKVSSATRHGPPNSSRRCNALSAAQTFWDWTSRG